MLTGFIRTVILFFVTTIVLRLMGKRQLAELQPYEVVITLMISDLATQPMNDVEIPLLSGVVSILTLLLMHSLLSALSFWSIRLRAIICGRPSVLVRNGKICEDELSRLCFDLSDLMEGIRSQGLIGLQETGSVILETNGALSVFPSAENRPATRGELDLEKKYDGIPLTLILDGKVQKRTLSLCGKDEIWLNAQLEAQGIKRTKDVLVALLSTQGVLLVQEKNGGRLLNIPVMKAEEVAW
ncbi:MAG: DUF421 domain-containing protein [Clostridia bacterium]|nr:DUF421 domain-containing protein [Clostridia bacterium]